MDCWHDISEIDKFRDHYEFNKFVVQIVETDEDGEVSGWADIAFGIAGIPDETKRFFCIPYDDKSVV